MNESVQLLHKARFEAVSLGLGSINREVVGDVSIIHAPQYHIPTRGSKAPFLSAHGSSICFQRRRTGRRKNPSRRFLPPIPPKFAFYSQKTAKARRAARKEGRREPGMAVASREQAISLLSVAKNHGDLAVKLSSLKQAREILLALDPPVAGELFPVVAELQSSPEILVRKCLVELVEDLGLKVLEQSCVLMPVLLRLLQDDSPIVVRQSIVIGTNFFCTVLEEMEIQFNQSGKVERWLDELWQWMVKFKDAVFGIALEPGYAGPKLLAMKFLEIYALLFTSDAADSEASSREGGGHPILDPSALALEGKKVIGLLLDLLHSVKSLRGSLIVAIINW
ncbi:hypothetical protein ACLOJK_003240 [Asimina triloba]